MKDKKRYLIADIEEVLATMDFSNVADDIAEIDDALELWVKGYAVVIPSLGIYVRKAIGCVFDIDANMFMPESEGTVICGQSNYWDILYFKQDDILSTLESYLNDRSANDVTTLGWERLSDIENLACYIEILNESN